MAKGRIAPSVSTSTRTVAVSPEVRAAYGSASRVKADDVWLEQELPGGQWLATARVARGKNGQPVIAELRVFPNEPHRPSARFQGRWGGELFGVAAPGVPSGGLRARTLRQVSLARIDQQLRYTVSCLLNPVMRQVLPGVRALSDRFSDLGLRASPAPVSRATPTAGKPRRGRPPLEPLVYARLARDYEEAASRTGAPVKALMQRYRMARAVLRSRIARARKDGYLQFNVPGRPGGMVTEKSRAILDAAARKPKRRRPRR